MFFPFYLFFNQRRKQRLKSNNAEEIELIQKFHFHFIFYIRKSDQVQSEKLNPVIISFRILFVSFLQNLFIYFFHSTFNLRRK